MSRGRIYAACADPRWADSLGRGPPSGNGGAHCSLLGGPPLPCDGILGPGRHGFAQLRQNAGMPTPISPRMAALPPLAASLFLFTLFVCGCASPKPSSDPLVMATLFNHTAAEFSATTRTLYQGAQKRLPGLAVAETHSAVLEQGPMADSFPPAVILDVDETVLDNSPFQVRLIEDQTSYPEGWDAWCDQATAKPIPGSLEFTKFAAAQGITVFYVTNRKAHLEAGTRQNLVALGFPVREDIDTVLMRGEREDWTSDKTTRRAHVAKDFRVLMLFGDNLGDFVALAEAKGTPAERETAMAAHSQRWGHDWVMLPNPMYGYWDSAVLGDAKEPSAREIHRLRMAAMDAMR